MAKKEVIAYDATNNRIELPGSTDEYKFSRNVYCTADVNLSLSGTGGLYLNDSAKLYIAKGSGEGNFLVSSHAGNLHWDSTVVCVANQFRLRYDTDHTLMTRFINPYGSSMGMNVTTKNSLSGLTDYDYQYMQLNACMSFQDAFVDDSSLEEVAIPTSFQIPYRIVDLNTDSLSGPQGADSSQYEYVGDSAYLNCEQFDIMPFTGRLMGMEISTHVDTLDSVAVRGEKARYQDTASSGTLVWEFVDSCVFSPSSFGGSRALDKVSYGGINGTERALQTWGETGYISYSLWHDSLRNNAVHAGDSVRFLFIPGTDSNTNGTNPRVYMKTNWGKMSYFSQGDTMTSVTNGYYDAPNYLGYQYISYDSAGTIGGWYTGV